jgi:hypothetical protein
MYQSASALARESCVAAAGACGAAAGGVFDVTAVGHVAGVFDAVDTAGLFALLPVDAEPDVPGVFRYHSVGGSRPRGRRLCRLFRCRRRARARRCRACLRSRRAAATLRARLERPELEDQRLRGTRHDGIRKLQFPRHQDAPDEVSVKIAGTCFMSLNCT